MNEVSYCDVILLQKLLRQFAGKFICQQDNTFEEVLFTTALQSRCSY